MPTAQQKQSEFVDESVDLALRIAMAKQRDGVLRQTKLFPEAIEALRAHLESHAQQQDAVVGALVEALEEALTDTEDVIDRHIMAYGENYKTARLNGMRDQLSKGRAALALVKDAK